ncbi:MAG: hypothetical protein ACSLE5_11885 [Porticoccaceae bacterium]
MDFKERQDTEIDLLLERLRVPALDLDRLSFAGTSPMDISVYASRLPIGNPPVLCKLLYAAMKEISRLRLEPKAKLAILETLLAVVVDCRTNLAKDTSLNNDTFERLSLVQALLKHQFMAYKSVAVELCKTATQPLNQNTLLAIAGAIHGAMVTATRLMLNCWQWYISPPERVWFELHTLYRLACHFGVTNHAFTEREQNRETRATLTATYLKPLLLSCTTPWRYTGAELKMMLQFLDRVAHLAELAPFQEDSVFVVNMNSDIGPVYAARVSSITQHHMRLRTERLLRALGADPDTGAVPVQVPELSERLVRDLRTYWSQEVVRADRHIPHQNPVDIVIGFAALHRELSGHANVTDFLAAAGVRPPPGYALRPQFAPTERRPDDPWQGAADTEPMESGGRKDAAIDYHAEIARPLPEQPSYRGFHLNTSERGACFEITLAPKQLSVGDLIGFGEPGNTERVQGIVRWIQVTPAFHRIVGVERLMLPAEPCAACILSDNQPVSAYFTGLLLSEAKDQLPVEIILPSIPFKRHQHVRLVSPTFDKPEQPAILANLVDSTFHLSRFTLSFDR